MSSAPPVGKTIHFPWGVQDHSQPHYFVWEYELLYLLLSSLDYLDDKMPVEQLFQSLWLQIDLIIDPFRSLHCSCAGVTWAEPWTWCHVFTANSSVEEKSPTGASGRVVVSPGRSLEETEQFAVRTWQFEVLPRLVLHNSNELMFSCSWGWFQRER